MSRSKKKDGMSAEELKSKMYQSLQSAGVLNDLRGYLRQSVINELRGRYKKDGGRPDDSDTELFIGSMKRSNGSSWEQHAIDNLVYQHLKQSRYMYSLSVFQQESGVDGYDDSVTEDLLRRLGAAPDLLDHKVREKDASFRAPHSSTPIANGNGDQKLLIWKILSRMSSPLHVMTKMDEKAERDLKQSGRQMSLAEKLQAIDEEMDGTLRQRRYDDVEQRKSLVSLASATRKAEEEAEKRARASFEQWKKVELATVRVQEQEKSREKILERTRKLEDDFAQRREALIARERNAIDRLNNQKDSMERDLHHQRQTLLQELEHIQLREKSLQERERILKEMELIKIRELDLIKAEALSDQLRNAGVKGDRKNAEDSVVSSCAESLRKSLTGKESRQLDQVLQELEVRASESAMLRSELETLKMEMRTTKVRSQEASPTPQARRQSPLDTHDRSLRQRLDTLTRQLDQWSSKTKTQRESVDNEEMTRWRQEMSKLSEVRETFEEKQRQLDDMMDRVSARIGSDRSARTPRKGASSGQLPSTSLRLLMDAQYDVTKGSSIRDYDPVHLERNVRWADKMPYSVNANLLGSAKSPRNASKDVSAVDMDTSNETVMSSDLSTSAVRRDIREKFKNLEKETEQLDQMYKRYINSNYKDVGAKLTDENYRNPDPKPEYKAFRESFPVPKSPATKSTLSESAHRRSPLKVDMLTREIPDLELSKLDASPRQQDQRPRSPTNSDVTEDKSKSRPELKSNESPSNDDASRDTPLLSMTHSRAESNHEDTGAVPGLSLKSGSSSSSEISERSSVSSISPRPNLAGPARPFDRPAIFEKKTEDIFSGRNLSKSAGSPDHQKSSDSPRSPGRPKYTDHSKLQDHPKSPNDLKSPDHQKSPDSLKSSEGPKPQRRPKSPDHQSDSEENDQFQDILRSIDQRSARSIEGDTDPKLADILNKVEPSPSQISTGPVLTSPTRPSGEQVVVASKYQSESDDSSSNMSERVKQGNKDSSGIGEKGFVASEQKRDRSDFSDDQSSASSISGKNNDKKSDYSDDFASSASEVKTMSDYEPTSTSVPRIEEKAASQELDEDRSGADINWSNLQPDKSGELAKSAERVEARQDPVVDFDESQSEQSMEAPDDEARKSSDEDFW